MIIRSVCNSCFEVFVITMMPIDVPLLKQISEDGMTCKCPRLCGGKINVVGDPLLKDMSKRLKKDPVNITGTQLYQAVNGAGLPDEIPKDLLVIQAMLKSNKIVASRIELANERFYLHELFLENGVTFHFSGGPRGAQLLKMTKPHSKLEEVSNGTASSS